VTGFPDEIYDIKQEPHNLTEGPFVSNNANMNDLGKEHLLQQNEHPIDDQKF